MERKIVTLDNLEYFYEKLKNQSGVFIGTQEEYDTAKSAGKIKTGSLVIILDPSEIEESTVTDESGNIGMKVASDAVYAKDFVSSSGALNDALNRIAQLEETINDLLNRIQTLEEANS